MQWFESWFNTPYYHILYKDRDYNEAEHFINLLIKDLEMPPHSRIVDLACGKGRHSIYLNKMDYNVLGLDLSEQSILHNKQFENETLNFAIHDMRDPMHVSEPVDAVFNLFTSFGYFENSEDDLKVFQSVYNAMKPGGYFVLDFLNEGFVRNTLVPHAVVEKEGIQFNISKRIEDNFVVKDIHFHDEGTDFHFFEKVKLSTPQQIEAYAKQVGFERAKVWGDYELNDFDPATSPRCINLFVKK
ncbi:class I SAM-dependent methyltransferase [Chryseobacterium sp. POL2]|uniref:class I SAM-dependent DNA methyltransferase n=1 Tax=Chryseobacterium sp. POL2 TaxID=2713414 RepID=UPI0013E14AEF|nr:class I SAM-dependent methyltransferase [Chryseobacterium sp. POL2]QIG88284.1 class I SAM-dependent methyltransferase [Chryseobacterium sp. POL2]